MPTTSTSNQSSQTHDPFALCAVDPSEGTYAVAWPDGWVQGAVGISAELEALAPWDEATDDD